jgi:hypothetical protein
VSVAFDNGGSTCLAGGDGGSAEKKKKGGLSGILGGCMNLIGGKKKNTGDDSYGSGGLRAQPTHALHLLLGMAGFV